MNNDPTTPPDASDIDRSDELLGSVLRSTFSAQADSDYSPPPVSLIAQRARAQARARAVSRTVVGIAASVTLLAGGLVTYEALRSDPAVTTVATAPAASTAQSEASASQAETTVDAGTAGDAGGSASTLSWAPADSGEASDAGLFNATQPRTIGDGRVVAQNTSIDAPGFVVSGDGNTWAAVATPPGFSPISAELSPQRWLVTGFAQNTEQTWDWPETKAFYSDDSGANWNNVAFEPAPADNASLESALVSGDHMVFVFKVPPDRSRWEAELMSLIQAQGLAPADATIESWSLQGTTVSFSTASQTAQNAQETVDAEQAESFESTLAPEQYSFTLSDEALAELDSHRGDSRIQIFAGDGAVAELTGEYVSWHTTGSSSPEGFQIAITTPQDELLLTSSDGSNWSETSISDLGAVPEGTRTTTRVGRWFVSGDGSELTIKSLAQLQGNGASTAVIGGWTNLTSLDVGPAGMVAVGFTSSGQQDEQPPELQIGWSTDGSNWRIEALSEAFGLERSQASVALAVGTDFVLAEVVAFTPVAGTETSEAQAPVWYRATLQ